MAKEAVLQVRMDAELQAQVEALYKDLGTSFTEAVRIFAAQSLKEQGLPFLVTRDSSKSSERIAQYSEKMTAARKECE